MSEVAPAPRGISKIVLDVRYPAHEIEIAAEVAYWQPASGRDHHLRQIIKEFDRLAPLVAELRAALAAASAPAATEAEAA